MSTEDKSQILNEFEKDSDQKTKISQPEVKLEGFQSSGIQINTLPYSWTMFTK